MTHCLGFTPLMVAKNNVLKVDEACLDIALLKDLAQALPDLGQQWRQRHRERYHKEELADHGFLQQIVRHGLSTA